MTNCGHLVAAIRDGRDRADSRFKAALVRLGDRPHPSTRFWATVSLRNICLVYAPIANATQRLLTIKSGPVLMAEELTGEGAEEMAHSRERIADRAVDELGELLGKCAAAEAEVVTTYFSKSHTTLEHISWLTQHTGRELTRVYQLGGLLSMQLAGLGVTVSPETFFETLTKLFEETNHFVMGYRLLTSLSGKAPYVGDLRRYDIFNPEPELPENAGSVHLAKEKKAVEDDLARETAPWAQLAGDEGILEGGGAGAFFAGSRLKGGDFEQRVAEMMQIVLDDELRHGAHQLEKLRDIPLTEDALQKLKGYVKRHANARVRFRNAHFAYPLSEQRMKEIEAGKIEPLFVWLEVEKSREKAEAAAG